MTSPPVIKRILPACLAPVLPNVRRLPLRVLDSDEVLTSYGQRSKSNRKPSPGPRVRGRLAHQIRGRREWPHAHVHISDRGNLLQWAFEFLTSHISLAERERLWVQCLVTFHFGSDCPALLEQTVRFSKDITGVVRPPGDNRHSQSQHSSIKTLGCVPNNNRQNVTRPTLSSHNGAISIPKRSV